MFQIYDFNILQCVILTSMNTHSEKPLRSWDVRSKLLLAYRSISFNCIRIFTIRKHNICFHTKAGVKVACRRTTLGVKVACTCTISGFKVACRYIYTSGVNGACRCTTTGLGCV